MTYNFCTLTAGLLLLGGNLVAQEAIQEPAVETVRVTTTGVQALTAATHPPVVELAICLDTSGSMDGLIETAKQRLWAVVNDLALAEPTPRLRVALLTYGNDGHEEAGGWVRNHTSFTEDLDMVSKELFGLRTNGGTELVGRVMNVALEQLDWSGTENALKIMVVAGNESADQDRTVDFRTMCTAAIAQDIMVSSIYCGGAADAEAPGWKQLALLSDGHFAVLDHNSAPMAVDTPFDVRLSDLSTKLNSTYLPFGELGAVYCENQWVQDENAGRMNGSNVAQRAATKAGKLYRNGHWDLVDATTAKDFELAKVKKEDLPENMQEMTLEEQKAHIEVQRVARAKVQEEIGGLAVQRDAFVFEVRRKAGLEMGDAFDLAIRGAMRSRGAAKGLKFPEPVTPQPESLESAPAEATTAPVGTTMQEQPTH